MQLVCELALGNRDRAHCTLCTEGEMEAPRSRAFSGSLGYFVKESANLAGTKRAVSQSYVLARVFNNLEDEIQKVYWRADYSY